MDSKSWHLSIIVPLKSGNSFAIMCKYLHISWQELPIRGRNATLNYRNPPLRLRICCQSVTDLRVEFGLEIAYKY